MVISFKDIFSFKIFFLTILVFLSAILLAVMISDSPGKRNGIYFDDNKVYSRATGELFSGRVVDTLENNILEYDVVNGIKEGEFMIFFKNGGLQMYGWMENNKNNDCWKYFYSNGQTEAEGFFNNDKPHGKWNWYYPNGKKKQEGFFINGNREGEWKGYDETGKEKYKIAYKNGVEVSLSFIRSYKS